MTGSRPAADALVEQGLQLYTSGRLDEALAKWREALALDPHVARAADYIQYVSDNRTALYRSFNAAAAVSAAAAEAAAPPAEREGSQSFDERTGDRFDDGEDALDWAADSGEHAAQPAAGAEAGEQSELTVRVDIDPTALSSSESEVTERIELHSYRPTIERSRPRMHTPLTVLRGEGQPTGNDFEPLEPTPVGIELPEPSRLVPAAESAASLGEAELELAGDQATPHRFGGAARDGFPEGARQRASTNERLDPIPDLPPPLPPPDADLSDIEFDEDTPGISPGAPTPDRLARVPLASPRRASAEIELVELPALDPLAPAAAPPTAAAPAPAADDVGSMIVRAWQLYEQGVHDGSLELCERVLAVDPQRAEARSLLERNREALLHQYEERLGDLDAIPAVRIAPDQIVWQKLDHRAGFLLSRVDGTLSFNDLLDVSGMNRFETCRILVQLLEQGVIGAAY